MKKIIFLFIIVLLFMGLSACKTKKDTMKTTATNNSIEVPATGVIIDASDKNNQIVYANPGDIIRIALYGKLDEMEQWSLREPITEGFVSLYDHKMIKENDLRLKQNEYISEWKFKVLTSSIFQILFNFENPLKPKDPLHSFQICVISGKKPNEIPKIIIQEPKNKEVSTKFALRGYTTTQEKTVYYIITNDKNENILEGAIKIDENSSRFEKDIELKKINENAFTLEVYQKKSNENPDFFSVKIPLTFVKK